MPVLGQAEAREAVLGQVARYWTPRPVAGPASSRTPEGFARFAEPGWAKAALSLQLTPLPGGRTLLAAETRVLATDPAARRAFARYWRLIRAGGAGLIRLELLRAIAHRAEHRRPRPAIREHGSAGNAIAPAASPASGSGHARPGSRLPASG